MRTLFRPGALGALIVLLAGCGGSTGSSVSEETFQRRADFWEIGQIQQKFHRATSKKDIDLMMSLYARNATLTIPGRTAAGKDQIRRFWLTDSDAFRPTNRWISDTPSYKLRVTADGDRGTLHFECHYIDANGDTVVVYLTADQEVARIDGKWLITDMVVGVAEPTP
jgi:ketosteroid isomerase-like protein